MDKSLGPTILYLTDSNIHMQCREKVQRKGIQSDAEPFNEYFSLEQQKLSFLCKKSLLTLYKTVLKWHLLLGKWKLALCQECLSLPTQVKGSGKPHRLPGGL